jgi:hypothetical protein
MKNLFILISPFLLFSSCIKYGQPKLLSLSGEYRVDKITYEEIDNSGNPSQVVYLPGDWCINPAEIDVLDSIDVGFFKMHLDYSMIRFQPIPTGSGSSYWSVQYPYHVSGQYSSYDLGYINFNCDGTRRYWKFIDDGVESLTIRTSGQWVNGNSGSNESFTLHMTRVGP